MTWGAGIGGSMGDLAFSEPRGLYATCFLIANPIECFGVVMGAEVPVRLLLGIVKT